MALRHTARPARILPALAIAILAAVQPGLPAGEATIVPVFSAAEALAAAMAVDAPPAAAYAVGPADPPATPNAVSDELLAGFPTHGPTFAILTSGDASAASRPSAQLAQGTGGKTVTRGDPLSDVTTLQLTFQAPAPCTLSFDYRFLSEEFPTFTAPPRLFNDAFIAQLDSSAWTASGGAVAATGAVAVETVAAAAFSAADAAGTVYGGATPLRTVSTPVGAGVHSLFLTIFDGMDDSLGAPDNGKDSAVFLDGFRLTACAGVPPPACPPLTAGTPPNCALAVPCPPMTAGPGLPSCAPSCAPLLTGAFPACELPCSHLAAQLLAPLGLGQPCPPSDHACPPPPPNQNMCPCFGPWAPPCQPDCGPPQGDWVLPGSARHAQAVETLRLLDTVGDVDLNPANRNVTVYNEASYHPYVQNPAAPCDWMGWLGGFVQFNAFVVSHAEPCGQFPRPTYPPEHFAFLPCSGNRNVLADQPDVRVPIAASNELVEGGDRIPECVMRYEYHTPLGSGSGVMERTNADEGFGRSPWAAIWKGPTIPVLPSMLSEIEFRTWMAFEGSSSPRSECAIQHWDRGEAAGTQQRHGDPGPYTADCSRVGERCGAGVKLQNLTPNPVTIGDTTLWQP